MKSILKSSWKYGKRGMKIMALTSIGTGTYYYKYDEGAARSMRFSAYITPMFWAYYKLGEKMKNEPKD